MSNRGSVVGIFGGWEGAGFLRNSYKKTFVRKACPAVIQSGYLPNISLEIYHYAILLSEVVYRVHCRYQQRTALGRSEK
jgi:hypothetical protein